MNAVSMTTLSDKRRHIEESICWAENEESKLPESILSMDGMSSRKNRHFLNNLCSQKDMSYLEVGTWKGSTFFSSCYDNEFKEVSCIDNWSEFNDEDCGNPKTEFLVGLNEHSDHLPLDLNYYECDCFEFERSKIKNPIDVFFYDGNHEVINQYRSLVYFNMILNDPFILIVDDWDWPMPKEGTNMAIKDLGYKVVQKWELPSTKLNDKDNWWNGLFIGLMCKE